MMQSGTGLVNMKLLPFSNFIIERGMAQRLAHHDHNVKVQGSIPCSPAHFSYNLFAIELNFFVIV